MRQRCGRFAMVVVLMGVAAAAVGCNGSERAIVDIQYVLSPSQGLPPGVESVAVLDADVNTATDQKWSEMAADYVQHLLQESNNRYGAQVRVADRKHTRDVMKEADLAAAGMVDSDSPGAPAKVLNVQALIMTDIKVQVEKHVGSKRTFQPGNLLGAAYYRSPSSAMRSEEVSEETRSVTVQTAFKMVDSATSENMVTHSPRPYQRTDKAEASSFFGRSTSEADMTPRDEIIALAVEKGAREFLAKIVPCPVEYEVAVKSSHQENCIQGVKYLRGEMYPQAFEQFKLALAEDPTDDRALFAAGVTCEAMGRLNEAQDYYTKACVEEDRSEYREARKRLTETRQHNRT